MASNSDVQYVAYLKAKFNLADADLLQVISLSQKSAPADELAKAPEGDVSEEIEEESYEEEKAEEDALDASGYEEVVEDDEYEEVVEYMDESVEEQEESTPTDEGQAARALAPVPAPAPGTLVEAPTPSPEGLVEAPAPSDAMVAFEETPDDEPDYAPSVKMPETIAPDPQPRRPKSVQESTVRVQEEPADAIEEGDEENVLAIEPEEVDPNTLAIVPAKSTSLVPVPDTDEEEGEPKGVEPPLGREDEEEKEEANTMLRVALFICLLLLIGVAVVLILIYVTGTIPKPGGGDPSPVEMGPYQPGNCNFEGQAQPNVISQCECNNQITTVADYTRRRYETLRTEFIPTVYTSWNLPIESCQPANQALLWLSTGDEINDQLVLLQRYILAYLYYSTQGQQWTTQTNWMTSNPECNWFGIACTGPNLQQVELLGNSVDGQIPTELSLLTQLNTLSLDENNIGNAIPTEIFSMTSLRTLTLGTNRLVGTIPTEIGLATGLENLRLNANLFRDAIPTQLNRLTRLRSLSLEENTMLTGRIATEYGRFTNLQSLSLSGTSIRAVIPTEYGNLANLQEIRLANTLVGGRIPTEFGRLVNLQIVDFAGSRFRKSIPAFLGSLTDLSTLMLGNNELEGPIPSELGRLSRLRYLDLQSNVLSGLLPSELGSLRSLENMTIQGNPYLSGNVPTEVCSLSQQGSLSNFTSDCPTREFGVLCPIPTCCSACVTIGDDGSEFP